MAHTLGIVFSPLDISKDEIRFVKLLPPISEEIECELIQVNLNSNPCYEALSYEWGPVPKDSFWITVDGTQCQVRQNLSDALRALRLPNKPRLLWIDALCINQDDTPERNHQVGKMGEIYKNARRAIVWLGLETYGEYDADDALRAITFLENTKRKPIEDFVLGGPEQRELLRKGYDRTWESVLHLCQRSYWARLWIIQEVVLATKIIVHCGRLKITWGVLGRLFAELERCVEFQVGKALRLCIPARLDQQRFSRKKSQDGSILLDMILINKHASCENVRDKVFGLHSLVRDCCRKAVQVDYSKTPIELCNDVLRHDFLMHRSSGYDFVGTTKTLQRILLGPWLHKSRRELGSRQPIIWSTAQNDVVMFAAQVVRLPDLKEVRYVTSEKSFAVIPSRPITRESSMSEGLLSKAVKKVDGFRKRSGTLTDTSVGKKDFDWVEIQPGDVVCSMGVCHFYIILREEKFAVYLAGEKSSPMFRILGSCLKRRTDTVVTRAESANIYLDIVTLQKLCLVHSKLWMNNNGM